MIFAIGGGLSIGKEGAFVHITAIISKKILKLKKLRFINKNLAFRTQFYAASVSAGFAAIFESTIGAMMFSIELTSSYYNVSNM